jgi:hypothetical protein
MPYLLKTFTDGTNNAVQATTTALSAWFAAHPGRLVDITTTRKSSARSNGALIVRALVQTGVPAPTYVAAAVIGTASLDLPAAHAAYVAAHPAYVLVRTLRCDATQSRTLSRGAMLCIFATTAAPEAFLPYVAEPQAPIPAGSSGTCNLVDGSGATVGASAVRNIGAGAWSAGQRSIATYLQSTSEWVGVPPS